MKKVLWVGILFFSGCASTYNQEDDLRTVPVTNNPHVVPNYGNSLPGMGSSQSPY